MQFGRSDRPEEVDFSLPVQAEHNSDWLAHLLAPADKPILYVGCAKWRIREWMGSVYPPKTRETELLRAYAAQFNSLEMNNLFYGLPPKATFALWGSQVPTDFRFCAKIPRSISHYFQLQKCEQATLQYLDCLFEWGEKLGLVFLQMQETFAPNRRAVLENYLDSFPKGIPMAVELRHHDWFAPDAYFSLLEWLRKRTIGWVITDTAAERPVCHLGLSASFAMVRFVGVGIQAIDLPRLDHWLTVVENWLKNGLHQVYFFMHDPLELLSPSYAAYFAQQAAQKAIKTKVPQLLNSGNLFG
jgi:uncharacterized protein YecE (DUF72 family)